MHRLIRTLMHPLYRAPDFKIGDTAAPYMLRWHIIPRNRLFNIYLHKFLRSDDPRALHDHPWHSLGVVLRGGYTEHLAGGKRRWRGAGSVTLRRATTAHRVELAYRTPPVWTLFITGPRIREWGFHCPNGWRRWQDFSAPHHRGQIGRGCE